MPPTMMVCFVWRNVSSTSTNHSTQLPPLPPRPLAVVVAKESWGTEKEKKKDEESDDETSDDEEGEEGEEEESADEEEEEAGKKKK